MTERIAKTIKDLQSQMKGPFYGRGPGGICALMGPCGSRSPTFLYIHTSNCGFTHVEAVYIK